MKRRLEGLILYAGILSLPCPSARNMGIKSSKKLACMTCSATSSFNILVHDAYTCMSSSIPILCAELLLSFLTLQVKKLLEHVNCQLPNLSQNLFILFNHWDQVAGNDEDSDSDSDGNGDHDFEQESERVKAQHLEKVRHFIEQGLKAKAVVDRTFFVSGKEACKAQENEKKGKQASASMYV